MSGGGPARWARLGALAAYALACATRPSAAAAQDGGPEGAAEPGPRQPVLLLVPSELGPPGRALSEGRPELEVRVVSSERSDRAELERARDMVEAARLRYVALELEAALAGIREAVVLLESGARERADFDLLAEALLVRGMAEIALGREAAAHESLLAAARLRPDRTLDEGRYPPPVRERYARLRSELEAEPASALTVTTRPAGARLFLDGEARGEAPTTLYATSGRHQLRVEAIAHSPRTLAVTLDPTGDQLEVLLPPADADTAARQVLEGEVTAMVTESTRATLREALGASEVIRVRADGAELAATRIDLRTGAVEEKTGRDLAALVRGLATPAVPTEVRPPDGVVEPQVMDGAFHNEGFYARLALGLALRTDEVSQGSLGGDGGVLSADLELAVGGSLAPGVVLGGALLALLGGPTIAVAEDSRPRVGPVGGLAVFLAWYPGADGGFHLQGAVGGARGAVRGGGDTIPDRELVGGVVSLGAGYEWWMAEEWGLGALLRLVGFTLRGEDVSWSAGGLSAVATLTYN